MADFGRGTGFGTSLRGRAENLEKYRHPGEYASRQAIRERLANELKHYVVSIGDDSRNIRYELAGSVLDLPQLSHMNMTVVAAALYVESKTPIGSLIPNFSEEDLLLLENRFFGITDRPSEQEVKLGLKADLIRYFGLIRTHRGTQETVDITGGYTIAEEEY